MGELTQSDIAEIKKICPSGSFTNVRLSEISRWRIGGVADLVVRPETTSQLATLRRCFIQKNIAPVVIGLTSNLLFSDKGIRVPVIQIGSYMSAVDIRGTDVYAEAGAWVPGLSRRLMLAGLSGAEHICGIPGTLGGLICMNGGSQRKCIGSSVRSVVSVDTQGQIRTRLAADCDFDYRKSMFQKNGEIVTAATLKFEREERRIIRTRMLAILSERRKKFPRKLPNCGSVFKANSLMYAELGPPGAVIEKLGLKGLSIGGAEISPIHANFIVNNGGACASDVLELIHTVRDRVESVTGYRLEAEACCVNENGMVFTADSCDPSTFL